MADKGKPQRLFIHDPLKWPHSPAPYIRQDLEDMRYDHLALVSCSFLLAASATAQDVAGGYGQPSSTVVQTRYEPAVNEHVNFVYAQVLSVEPVYQDVQIPRQVDRCENYQRTQRRAPRGAGGTVLGAIIGGAIGNQIGSGSGRRAATVAGAIAGGAIGHEAGREDHVYDEQHCFVSEEYVIESQLAGYDVEYRYRGEVFMSRLDRHPGDRLRIRVAVSPAESMDASIPAAASGTLRH